MQNEKVNTIKEEDIIKICLGLEADTKSIIETIKASASEPFIDKYCSFLQKILKEINGNQINELKKKSIQSAMVYVGQKLLLNKIDESLKDTSIKLILLKSAALNENIYRSETIRPGCDIDILIKDSDYITFTNIISQYMYKYKEKEIKGFAGLYEETWISKNNSKIIIDLHTQITNPFLFKFNLEEIFNSSEKHPAYNSNTIRILSPEYMLISLSLHCFNDGNFQGHSIFDVINLLTKEHLNLELTLSLATKLGCKSIVEYTIYKAYKIMSNRYLDKESWTLKVIEVLYKKTYKEKTYKRRVQQLLGQLILVDDIKIALLTQYKYIKKRLSH